jgi:hypothetical protein
LVCSGLQACRPSLYNHTTFPYLTYTSTPKMEARWPSKMSTNVYKTTWHHIPEDSNHHGHCCKNLKSLNSLSANKYATEVLLKLLLPILNSLQSILMEGTPKWAYVRHDPSFSDTSM